MAYFGVGSMSKIYSGELDAADYHWREIYVKKGERNNK